MSSILNPTIPESIEPLPNGGLDIRGIEDQENRFGGSANADNMIGGNLNDVLDGIGGNDTIIGGAGNDEILGGAGNDSITAGTGENTLFGGTGNDTLSIDIESNVSQQSNSLTGGDGADTFELNFPREDVNENRDASQNTALDNITDFTPGEDKIVIRGLESNEAPTYDRDTGILSIGDLDIAQLSAGLNISEADLEVADDSNGNTGEATVYRFYDSSVGVHFYTADEVEKDAIQQNLDNYQFEGESYRTVDATTGAQEVYRFFNPATGVHLYTTDEIERDSIIANLPDFQFEGVKFYAYETEVAGSIPVYRFYEPTLGVHFYTPNEVEKNAVRANLTNYSFEGIAYYALPVDEIQ